MAAMQSCVSCTLHKGTWLRSRWGCDPAWVLPMEQWALAWSCICWEEGAPLSVLAKAPYRLGWSDSHNGVSKETVSAEVRLQRPDATSRLALRETSALISIVTWEAWSKEPNLGPGLRCSDVWENAEHPATSRALCCAYEVDGGP